MGHEIVRRQSQADPGRQSRLWLTNDIIRVLKNNSDRRHSPTLSSKKRTTPEFWRLLEDEELMVAQDHSHIQQLWQGTKKLEHVDLSDSQYLVENPDFTNAPNLKTLILQGCTKLRNLHSSVGALKRLIFLNLKGCTSLTSLPCNISWDSLEILILSGCTRLWKFPETMGNINHLRQLSLDGIALLELPSSIGHLTGLSYLSLRGCKSLLSLPSAICGLTSLKTLVLCGCSQLEEMPEGVGNLEHLEELDISETAIRQFPSSITRLQNLKRLSFLGCSNLPPKSMFKRFVTWFRGNLDIGLVLPTSLSSTLCSLERLSLSYCHLVDGAIPSDLSALSSLLVLDLSGNDFTLLPESISQLSKLSVILLSRCSQLQSVSDLPSSLVYVNALDCTHCFFQRHLGWFKRSKNSNVVPESEYGFLEYNLVAS
ncbi:TMV resistance protein N-like [Juglans regia]|nr:TMV resistance protein N-like [Juglans regia]